MNRALFSLLALTTFTLTSPALLPAAKADLSTHQTGGRQTTRIVWRANLETALEESIRTGKPVMASFMRSDGSYSQQMERETYTDSQVIALAVNFICVKVEVSSDYGKQLLQDYAVKDVPTVIFFNGPGKISKRSVGFYPAADFLPIMRQGLNARPVDAETYAQRGHTAYDRQNYVEAEAEFRQATQQAPSVENYWFMLGQSLYGQARYADAEQAFREACRLLPNSGSNIWQLGLSLYMQAKYAEAESAFREAVRRYPADAEVRNFLGNALFSQNKFGASEEQYRESIRLKPSYAAAHANLAGTLLKQGLRDEAIDQAQQAIRLGMKEHWVFKELGLIP